MEIKLLRTTGVPQAEVEAHKQIQKEFSSSNFSKGWRGYASFSIARAGQGSGDSDFDLVLVTHAIILVVELKNWHGKILKSDGQRWILDDENRDTSPVIKANLNAKKLASLMKQKLGPALTPFVKSVVVLHGSIRKLELPEDEARSVMTMEEFLALRYEHAFREFNPQRPQFNALDHLKKYDEFFQGRSFKPKDYLIDGFRPGIDAIFQHPDNLYKEFKATAKDDPLSLALLRLWDFTAIGLDLIGEKDRSFIGLREQRVYEYISSRDEELSLSLLRPITRKSQNDVTLDFAELFALPNRVTRLAEFTNSILPKLSPAERLAIAKTVLQRFARLHDLNVAHRDVGDHSIWLDRSSKVVISGFPAAYYPELKTVGSFRDKVKVEKSTLPEDIAPSPAATPFNRDVFMLGALSYLILYGEKPGKDGHTFKWSTPQSNPYLEEVAQVIQRSLDPDPSKRYQSGREMLEALNAAASHPDLVIVDPRSFEAFKARTRERDYEIAEEIEETDEFTSFRSTSDKGSLLVKAWHGVEPDPRRPDESVRLLSFLERARALRSCAIPGLPQIVDFGLSRRDLLLVTEWVEGVPLDEWLTNEISLNERVAVADSLTECVSTLHSLNLSHGDIHPRNIIVGEEGIPYLIDVLDYRRGGGDAYTTAYLPANYKSLTFMERDRYSLAAVLAELFGSTVETVRAGPFPTPRVYEELSNILSAELLSTLDPLARALGSASGSEEDCRPTFHVVVPQADIQISSPSELLADNGKFYIKISEDNRIPGAYRVYLNGVGHQLSFQWNPDENRARYGKLSPVQQSQLLRSQSSGVVTIGAKVIVSVGDHLEIDDLAAYIFEDEQVRSRLPKPHQARPEVSPVNAVPPAIATVGDESPHEGTAPYARVPISELWKALIDAEEDAFKTVTVAGERRADPSVDGQILVPYHFDSGALNYEDSDTVLVENQLQDGSWRQCGQLNLDDTTLGENAELAIVQVNSKASFRIGDRLRFVSKDDKASFTRRREAVDRVLRDKAIVPNLVSYFDELNPWQLTPAKYPEPTDADLAIYSQQGKQLNPSQAAAFKKVLGNGPISLLQGPPGTGKTWFIASLLHHLMTREGARHILLVSQAHEAVNNALEKGLELCRSLDTEFNAVRLGPEASCSESIRHLHVASIENCYREAFKAEQKERIVALATSMGLPAAFATDMVDLHIRLGMLHERIEKLSSRMETTGDKDKSALEARVNSLRETYFQIATDVYGVSPEEDDDMLNRIIEQLREAHGVVSADAVARLRRLIGLSEEWLSTLGSYDGNFAEFLAKSRTIVAGTLVGIGHRATGVVQNIYDWVIIDEAGRAAPSELAVAMQAGHRILLVGDHKQLPPTFPQEVMDAIKKRFGAGDDSPLLRSDFERVFQSSYGAEVGTALLSQYRMAPSIGQIASHCFYDDKLETGRGAPPEYYDLLPEELSKQATWIDTHGLGTRGQEKRSDDERDTWNEGEAHVVMGLVKRILESDTFMEFLMDDLKPQEPPIGIICMYSKQRALIDRLKSEATWLGDARRLIKVDTVDSYQGKENRIVIVSTVRNNPSQRPGFLRSPNRVNVAVSRAMERLFIVGSTNMWKGRNADMPLGRVLGEMERLAGLGEARFLPASTFLEH